jgi:hypothetical protein
MIKFRVHALRRMFERNITHEAVVHVLTMGETIERYPQDFPYPSQLILGWWQSRPIHVVVADDNSHAEMIVVTVYQPDAEMWTSGYIRRKS